LEASSPFRIPSWPKVNCMDIGKKFVASNGVLGEAADDVTILQGGSRNPVISRVK